MKTVPFPASDEDLKGAISVSVGADKKVTIYYPGDELPKLPAPAEPGVVVTPRQFRQALTKVGLRAAVDAFVATQNQDTKDWYEYATEFDSGHPMVTSTAAAMGKGAADIKAVFELAASL